MGKYTALRSKLPAFEHESSFQDKVNAEKLSILGSANDEDANVNKLAALFAAAKATKDAHEDQISLLNIRLEALSQMIVAHLQSKDIESVSLSSGATVYLQDSTYPGIEDEKKFYDWMHRNKMDDLLTLNFQTLKGMVSEHIQSGKALPPGTRCFLKTQARVRNGNSKEE